jgi:hypothetical protein
MDNNNDIDRQLDFGKKQSGQRKARRGQIYSEKRQRARERVMAKKVPMEINAKKVLAEIQTMSREPFREQLSDFLAAAPDLASIKLFARKNPDKWAGAVKTLSSMAGYQDQTSPQGDTNIYMQINQLPDSELQHKLTETLASLERMKEENAGNIPAENNKKGAKAP